MVRGGSGVSFLSLSWHNYVGLALNTHTQSSSLATTLVHIQSSQGKKIKRESFRPLLFPLLSVNFRFCHSVLFPWIYLSLFSFFLFFFQQILSEKSSVLILWIKDKCKIILYAICYSWQEMFSMLYLHHHSFMSLSILLLSHNLRWWFLSNLLISFSIPYSPTHLSFLIIFSFLPHFFYFPTVIFPFPIVLTLPYFPL